MTYRDHKLPDILLGLAIIVFSGAFLEQPILGTSPLQTASSRGQILNSMLYVPVYLLGLWLLLSAPGKLMHSIRLYRGVVAFTVLAMLSAFWAVSPQKTLIDGVQLGLTLAVAMAIAASMPFERALKRLSLIILTIMVCSLIYIYAFPSIGVMHTNDFSNLNGLPQGVFTHKNRLAEVATIGICAAVAGYGTLSGRVFWPLLLTCVVALIISESVAKLASALLAIGAYATWKLSARMSSGRMLWLISGVLLIAFLWIALPLIETVALNAVNKSTSLSGRTLIWAHVRSLIADRPLLGYGGGSIWNTDYATTGDFLNYRPPHAHNLYLEMALRFGVVGAGLVVWLLIRMAWPILVGRALQPQLGSFAFLIYISAMVRTPFEVTLFRDNQIGFLILLVVMGFVLRARDPATGAGA